MDEISALQIKSISINYISYFNLFSYLKTICVMLFLKKLSSVSFLPFHHFIYMEQISLIKDNSPYFSPILPDLIYVKVP